VLLIRVQHVALFRGGRLELLVPQWAYRRPQPCCMLVPDRAARHCQPNLGLYEAAPEGASRRRPAQPVLVRRDRRKARGKGTASARALHPARYSGTPSSCPPRPCAPEGACPNSEEP